MPINYKRCPKCNERNNPEFLKCWQCQESLTGIKTSDIDGIDDFADRLKTVKFEVEKNFLSLAGSFLSIFDTKKLSEETMLRVLEVAKSMMDETERVYRNHVRYCGASEVNDRGLFIARLFAINFADNALIVTFGTSDQKLCLGTGSAIISLAAQDIDLSREDKGKIVLDVLNEHNQALFEITKSQPSGFERLSHIYLEALSASVGSLEETEGDFAREQLPPILISMLNGLMKVRQQLIDSFK